MEREEVKERQREDEEEAGIIFEGMSGWAAEEVASQ